MQAFAQAEAAVTKTLLFLSSAGERGKAVQLRHLLGQRLDDIARALGPGGGFVNEGSLAHAALMAFRTHGSLRARLSSRCCPYWHRAKWHLGNRLSISLDPQSRCRAGHGGIRRG